MRHFHRTHLHPDVVLATADAFFPTIGMHRTSEAPRARTYRGSVGTPEVPSELTIAVKMEGGHYTFVEVHTDQVGESRIDKNVKKYFNQLHRAADPRHTIEAGY